MVVYFNRQVLAREEDQISAANYFSGDQFRVDVSH
jgi:hypothetical protein